MSEAPSFQQELQIEVKAGQTLVLEIVAQEAPRQGPPAGDGEATGSFDLVLAVNGDTVLPLSVYLVGSAQSYEVNAAETGYHLDGIKPGTYTLSLARPGNLVSPHLPGLGNFEIRILDSDGRPVTGDFLTISEDGGRITRVKVLDGAGRVDGLAAGNYVFLHNPSHTA